MLDFCLRVLLLAVAFQPVASFAVVTPAKPWLRLDNDPQQMKMNKMGTYLAYVESTRPGLYVVNTANQNVYQISRLTVGGSFFWSPDGHRLFYREMNRKDTEVKSEIKVYDTGIHKNVSLSKIKGASGFLTFDPRQQGMRILHNNGIKKNEIKYPGRRSPKFVDGEAHASWLVTPKGVLQLSADGQTMTRIEDDKSGVNSYDISSDGQYIAWATKKGFIYFADATATVGTKIDHGLDPAWHPNKPVIIYAGARLLGTVASGYDIKVSDLKNHQKFLTDSAYSNERWPIWQPDGKTIIYTKQQTTDLYKLNLKM